MGLRPGRCYKWDSPAYTRISNNPVDSYIKGIPGSKIIRYNMGDHKGDFNTEVSLVLQEDLQIRHNAIEAARMATNRVLERGLGLMNYHFKIRVYPHHVLRENVMATGAGADRVQSGMRNSFGKPVGVAARVHKGQPVFAVYVNDIEKHIQKAKESLLQGKNKLPGKMKVIIKEADGR